MLSLQAPTGDADFCGVYTSATAGGMLPSASEQFMMCRFCAQMKNYDKELLDLSRDRNVYDGYTRILEFFKITFVDLADDNMMPKTTCEPCYNSMQAAYTFFRMVKRSQYTLAAMYQSSDFPMPVKLEPQVEDCVETSNEPTESPFAKKLKSESNNCEFEPHCDIKSSLEGSLLPMPLLGEPAIPIAVGNVIHTPSFGDVISDQIMETGTELLYSDSENDADVKDVAMPLYEVVPIYDNKKALSSWDGYKWGCGHCARKYSSLVHLRKHSMSTHKTCFAFECGDCDGEIATFEAFIEHVREHRGNLRNYCKYCNEQFDSCDKCVLHEKEHEEGKHVCNLCGELFPTSRALTRHQYQIKKKRTYKTVKKIKKFDKSWTWEDYEWWCQECGQREPCADALRDHAQKLHNKCFAMKCMDCQQVMSNFRMFVDHVKKHRPYLKSYCQYCNVRVSRAEAAQHAESHAPAPPCPACGRLLPAAARAAHLALLPPPRRAPAAPAAPAPAALACATCHKQCRSAAVLRQHQRTHDAARRREYTCHTCGKSFYTAGMLKEHIRTHDEVKTEVCEICGKKFHSKPKLKAHVATHSALRPFACAECGKCFRTEKRLKVHCLQHTDIKPYKCLACGKEFRYKVGLKVHENQHTGLRPYPCERCDKTFGNWANCNKHMIRKHGFTLAKTKLTALGRLEIDRETGQPADIQHDDRAKQWMDRLINEKRARGKPRAQPSTS